MLKHLLKVFMEHGIELSNSFFSTSNFAVTMSPAPLPHFRDRLASERTDRL
jgi:hypothetical protein